MRFLIHIPTKAGEKAPPAPELFRSVGLPESLAQGVDVMPKEGPGGPGLMFGWLDSKQPDNRYLKDQQTWIPSNTQWGGKQGAYWVGIWKDSPPTEQDLRRPDHRQGVQIRLGDDDSWSIPTPNTLDRFPQFDSQGKLTWSVDEEFNWLTTDLEKRKSTGLNEDGDTVSFIYDDETDFEFICRLIQVNYRITPEVIVHLRLLSETAIRGIVSGLMGYALKD